MGMHKKSEKVILIIIIGQSARSREQKLISPPFLPPERALPAKMNASREKK